MRTPQLKFLVSRRKPTTKTYLFGTLDAPSSNLSWTVGRSHHEEEPTREQRHKWLGYFGTKETNELYWCNFVILQKSSYCCLMWMTLCSHSNRHPRVLTYHHRKWGGVVSVTSIERAEFPHHHIKTYLRLNHEREQWRIVAIDVARHQRRRRRQQQQQQQQQPNTWRYYHHDEPSGCE